MKQASDPFDLKRFLDAQEASYECALAELRAGLKETHWSWYVLPQVAGLGSSPMSRRYAIRSLAEAKAYLAHPVLGTRLRECVAALNAHDGLSAERILGDVDAQKLRSCLTLFLQVAPADPILVAALSKYFAGRQDPATLAILAGGRQGD
ncbi:MAG: hypothetical protein CMLOHMNK_03000 [Steroidobacteraceae bacterium]|nr:hypothetical protein [Steroidobacteraceae bacterium]